MFKRPVNLVYTPVLLTLILGVVLLPSGVSFGADTYTIPQTAQVTLAWDFNDPAPDGYRIYQRTDGQSYDYSQPCWTGSDNTGTVYNLNMGTTYYFVVRAYKGALESADSEEVNFTSPSVKVEYTISSSGGDNGVITPNGLVSVSEGADQTFILTPDLGFHVDDVKVDGLSKGAITSYTFSQLSANHNIEGSFAIDTHIISAVAGENGNITPAGNTSVVYGDSQKIIIAPHDGCRVANVFVDGVDKGAILSYTFDNVTESHAISASFVVDAHQITATAGDNGSIFPSGIVSVDYGGSQLYSISADSGYHVADVVVDGVSIGPVNTYSFDQIGADHSIHAIFSADTFVITSTSGANGTISPAGDVDVTYGGNQSYTFAVNSGFCIEDVQVDGQSIGAVGSYTFTNVTSDHRIAVSYAESKTVRLHIEAEDGDLVWPMEIADDDSATAGGFIWAPVGTEDSIGSAEYHFEVPETGDYVIWGRQISNESVNDSFFVSVDGQAEMAWKTKFDEQENWTWDVVSYRTGEEPHDTTDPRVYRLEAGYHSLTIQQREGSSKLDTIVIANDLNMEVSDLDAEFQAPVIEAETGDLFISEMGAAVISFVATDPGNGNLTYAWEIQNGGSITGSSDHVEFTPELIGPHPCPYQVKVVVSSDASLLSSTYVFKIYVKLVSDINGDGVVNMADLAELRFNFGQSGDPGWITADLNVDGYVNFSDLAVMRRQFGQNGCPFP